MSPTAATEADQTAARPFREGLLSLDPPRLLGSHCRACGTATFPARDVCPACRAGDVAGHELSTRGHIHSFTVVRQAPAGVEVPYVLAWIDLPADDVRLMAQVVGVAPEEVDLGLPVALELVPFGHDGAGAPLMGHRFRVIEEVTA